MATYDYSHGIEVEQYPADTNTGTRCSRNDVMEGGIPGEVPRLSSNDSWHRDGSGPQEADYGPYKQVKSLLNAFKRDCRDDATGRLRTWNWHNSGPNGGCGSHVHLHVGDGFSSSDEEGDGNLEAWTVTWNTAVELVPFMLPMFCADWSEGFRDSADYWASPNTTRYSQSTMGDIVANPSAQSRNYDAVTWNGADFSGKPLTLELRVNEAHPGQAVVGLLFLRRMCGRCVEKGWSPKLAGNRSSLMADIYSAVYNSDDPIEALRNTGPVRFEEGRGIPGLSRYERDGVQEFENALQVFRAILSSMGTDSGNYKDRIKALILARIDGKTDLGPEELGDELWKVDEDSRFWNAVDERRWQDAEFYSSR